MSREAPPAMASAPESPPGSTTSAASSAPRMPPGDEEAPRSSAYELAFPVVGAILCGALYAAAAVPSRRVVPLTLTALLVAAVLVALLALRRRNVAVPIVCDAWLALAPYFAALLLSRDVAGPVNGLRAGESLAANLTYGSPLLGWMSALSGGMLLGSGVALALITRRRAKAAGAPFRSSGALLAVVTLPVFALGSGLVVAAGAGSQVDGTATAMPFFAAALGWAAALGLMGLRLDPGADVRSAPSVGAKESRVSDTVDSTVLCAIAVVILAYAAHHSLIAAPGSFVHHGLEPTVAPGRARHWVPIVALAVCTLVAIWSWLKTRPVARVRATRVIQWVLLGASVAGLLYVAQQRETPGDAPLWDAMTDLEPALVRGPGPRIRSTDSGLSVIAVQGELRDQSGVVLASMTDEEALLAVFEPAHHASVPRIQEDRLGIVAMPDPVNPQELAFELMVDQREPMANLRRLVSAAIRAGFCRTRITGPAEAMVPTAPGALLALRPLTHPLARYQVRLPCPAELPAYEPQRPLLEPMPDFADIAPARPRFVELDGTIQELFDRTTLTNDGPVYWVVRRLPGR